MPGSLAADDPRLPHVDLGRTALRLNTEPVPSRFLAPRMTHETRIAATGEWLKTGCGDYAVGMRLFIDAYLAFAAREIARNQDEAAARLAPFDGLFAPQDWLWSALRPLPHGWVSGAGGRVARADFVFWDGSGFMRVSIGADRAEAADAVVLREADLRSQGADAIAAALPMLAGFWRDEAVPSSPFRMPWTL